MLLELEELELLLQLEIKNKQQKQDAAPVIPTKPATPVEPVEKMEKPATPVVPVVGAVPCQTGIGPLLSTCYYNLASVDHVMHPKVKIMLRHSLWTRVWSLMISMTLFCAFVFQAFPCKWLFLGCLLQVCGHNMLMYKVPSVMSLDCGSCVDRGFCG